MDAEKQRQENLRAQVYDPAQRWHDLMARIEWAERERVHRATPEACIREQNRLWAAGYDRSAGS